MVNGKKLQSSCSKFLKGERVVASGIFTIYVSIGKGMVAPIAAGMCVGKAVDAAENTAGVFGHEANGAGATVGIIAKSRIQHRVYKNEAQKKGLTPVMICAITETKIYFLDWKGNVRWGSGPNKILFEFNRNSVIVQESGKLLKTFVLSEGGASVTVQAAFGLLSANKAMNRNVINEFKSSIRE